MVMFLCRAITAAKNYKPGDVGHVFIMKDNTFAVGIMSLSVYIGPSGIISLIIWPKTPALDHIGHIELTATLKSSTFRGVFSDLLQQS